MTLSRRHFLRDTLAIGCTAAASPLFTPVTFASAPTDNRLVVIVLRGGMDALHAIAPVADPLWRQYRPTLGRETFHDLNGFFALHDELSGLLPMWQAGELGFAQAVSTPYRDKRSHFDGQDLLEAGVEQVTSGVRDSGWANRMLSLLPGAESETAFAVGREDMLILRGPSPSQSWAPDGRIDLSPQAQLLLDVIYSKDPLFAEAGRTAMTLAGELSLGAGSDLSDDEPPEMGEMMDAMLAAAEDQTAESLAAFAARRLAGDTRFATFSIGGWDTHLRQTRSMRGAMKELQSALVTLKRDLGPVWGKTTVIAMTEFGRTARENGTEGTDHGTGGAMVLAGGAIRGRSMYGRWPGLAEADLYARRDLMPTADVRQYAGWALHDLFGLSGSDIERTVFPGLDLGTNPGFIL